MPLVESRKGKSCQLGAEFATDATAGLGILYENECGRCGKFCPDFCKVSPLFSPLGYFTFFGARFATLATPIFV